MPGLLEEMISRIERLEHDLAEMRVVPTDPADVWADGGVRVVDAAEFTGLSRSELYTLMSRGELPWSKPGRHRLVPRRWLRQYLMRKMIGGGSQAGDTTGEPKTSAPKGKPKK